MSLSQIILNIHDDHPIFGSNPIKFFMIVIVMSFIGGFLFKRVDSRIEKKQKDREPEEKRRWKDISDKM